jgi:hypothetical protein
VTILIQCDNNNRALLFTNRALVFYLRALLLYAPLSSKRALSLLLRAFRPRTPALPLQVTYLAHLRLQFMFLQLHPLPSSMPFAVAVLYFQLSSYLGLTALFWSMATPTPNLNPSVD